jgi:hypothetical protein
MLDFSSLNPVQCVAASLFFKHKHLMLILPRQIGKTELGVRLLNSCMDSTMATRKTTFMAKSLDAAKRASREKFMRVFPAARFRVNTENVISKKNEASICYIQSVDREPDRIRGGSFHCVHWSEVAFSKFDKGVTTQYVLDAVIRPTMRATHGYSILESTTNGKNDWYYLWEDANNLGYKRLRISLGMMVDLGLFSRAEYDEIKRTTHPDIFRQEYECEWVSFSGAVFPEFREAEHIQPVLPPEDWQRIILGIDWGFKDATAILFAYVKDGITYVFDEIYEREKTLEDINRILWDRIRQWRTQEPWKIAAVADHEPARNEELCRRGIPCAPADKADFLGSVLEVKEHIFKGKVVISPRCTDLKRDLLAAQWHPKKTNELDEGVCSWGHYDALSAFRYLLRECKTVESVEPVKNPVIDDPLSAMAWEERRRNASLNAGTLGSMKENNTSIGRDSNGNDIW